MSERKLDRNDNRASRKGMSRRGFLKGAGVSAAGAALADTGLTALAQNEATNRSRPVLGPGAVDVKLRINGKDHNISVEPRTTLADALRTHLDLTGTKVVCD